VLCAPFEAMDAARGGNTCAIALLAAARWLYLADREPNELERVERLLCVWNAREALCDRIGRGQGDSDQRWMRLVASVRLRARLRARGYSDDEITGAFDWSRSLRDLAAHTADSVLVGLDYPVGRRAQLHGRALAREDLALPEVTSNWPIFLEAVRHAARRLAGEAIETGWSEEAFHRRMSPRRSAGRQRSKSGGVP
jgi:hypothetical protein